MKRGILISALLVSMGFLADVLGQEKGAPLATRISPENGAEKVATDVREIVVTFDQPMDTGGFSFVGGGPTFPKTTGKPFWRTETECVLPVMLEPGKSYRIGLNSERFQNFRSKQGVVLLPVEYRFSTDPEGAAMSTPESPVDRLKNAIENRYSYRDVRKVDWDVQWQKYENELRSENDPKAFAILAGEMLAATGDPHIWLKVGEETVPAFRREVRPNGNFELLPKLIANWNRRNRNVALGSAAPDIGYIGLLSFQADGDGDELKSVLEAIRVAAEREMKGLVIDVRFNAGGSELMAQEIAGCFIEERKLYAKHRNPGEQERWLEPSGGGPRFRGKVAVLTGPYVMSSAEGFLLMMRQVEKAKLIGANSFGSSGNPMPHELGNGVTVMLPSWQAMLPGGEVFEKVGIAPDIEVKTEPDDFEKSRDPVLEAAIGWLQE